MLTPRHFLAGGAVKNEARVFVEGEVICKISGMVREVLTCDWNHANDKFLVAGADGFIRVFNVNLDEYDKDRASREEMEAQGVMIQYAK